MVWFSKGRARSVTASMCVLILIFLLAACGGHSSSAPTNNHSASLANPVQHVLAPTATKSVPYTTYTGTDFTLKYPAEWKVITAKAEVSFTDLAGNYNLTIGSTPNPNGATTPDQLADSGVVGAKTNLQNEKTIDVPKTVMLAGQTWSQRSLSGISTLSEPNSEIEATVLATNHPAKASNTQGYIIVYVAAKNQFDQAQTRYFKPILQSLKFK